MPSQGAEQRAVIEALVARLLELARSPDEAAVRAELATWLAGLDAFAALRDSQMPVKSVIAAMLWALNEFNAALSVAYAAARNGQDELSKGVITNARAMLLQMSNQAMHAKRLDVAKTRLQGSIERLREVCDMAEEKAALNLIARVEAVENAPRPNIAVEGRPTLIKLAAWGERFIDSAAHEVLACCLAPGNVPGLARFGTVILHLHTRARDAERVRSLPVIRELARHARIEIALIPEELDIPSHLWGLGYWSRNILAFTEYESLVTAQRLGADMMCIGADLVIADGSLVAAKEKLVSGYEIYLVSALRATTEKLLPRLGSYRAGDMLQVPAQALYRLSLETIHPSVRQQFMRREPDHMPADPHQFFFARQGEIATRAFIWHPLAFATRSLPGVVGFDMHTIDCRFASDLSAGKDKSAICYAQPNPPEGAYVVSLDTDRGIESFGRFEVSPAGVAASMDHWVGREEDFDYFKWILRQRAVYRLPEGLALDLPQDCREEEPAIEETIAHLERRGPAIRQRIASYAQMPRGAVR